MRIVVIALLLAACTNPAPVTTDSGAAAAPAADTPVPRVIFPDGFAVRVEIANDPELRAQGLMFRDRLDAGAGMLFLFPRDDVFSFWMKNTRIPLDMIFIDADKRIVGIQHDVPPCKFDPCPSYGPGVIARYVLEVGGGQARAHNLKTGDVLRFEDTDRFAVRE